MKINHHETCGICHSSHMGACSKNQEEQYNLYFSKIIYRDYYFNIFGGSKKEIKCELHGDELIDDEVIEIKWNNEKLKNVK